jgi:hypothetical protein
VHPLLTPPVALERMARALRAHGVRRWVLQTFRAQGCEDARLVAAPTPVLLDAALRSRLSRYVSDIVVRA